MHPIPLVNFAPGWYARTSGCGSLRFGEWLMKFRFVRAVAAALLACGSIVSAATVTDQWKSATTGDWFTAGNWSTNGVPNNDANNTYLALIAATGSPYTVTLNTSGTINLNSLSVTSPNATFNLAAGTLNTTNGVNFSAGTVNLSGGTFAGGTVTFGNNVTTNVNGLVGVFANIVNNGTTNIGSGNELFLRFASFYNNGYLRLQDDNVRSRYPLFATSGTEALNNTGTVVFNSTGIANPFFPINNNGGTILINATEAFFGNGDLHFTGNSYVGGAGTFEYYNPSYMAGMRLYNSGTLLFSGGKTILYGDVFNYNKMSFTGAVAFAQGSLGGGGTYNLTATSTGLFGSSDALYEHDLAGTLNNAGTLGIQASHYLLLNNGTLNNSGTFNLSGNGNLSAAVYDYDTTTVDRLVNTGTIGVTGTGVISVPLYNSGTITVASGGSLTFNEVGTFTGNSSITGAGVATFTSATFAIPSGSLALSGNDLTFYNATINLAGNLNVNTRMDWWLGQIIGSGTLNVTSNGSLNFTTSDTNTLSANLVNNGTVNLTAGQLRLSNGTFQNNGYLNIPSTGTAGVISAVAGTNSALINTGTMNVATGSHSISANQFSNFGTISSTNATISLGSASNVFGNNSLITTGGTVIFSGPTRFDGGALAGSGTFINRSTMSTGTISGNRTLNARFINAGTLDVSTQPLSIGSIGLTNTGTLLAQTNQSGTYTPLGAISTLNPINNSGTMIVSNSAGSIALSALNNTGTFIANGGTVTIVPSATLNSSYVLGTGTWLVQNGAKLSFQPTLTIDTNAAVVTVSGNGSVFTPIQNLFANTGSLTLLNNNHLTFQRTFQNNGVMTADATSDFTFTNPFYNLGSLLGRATGYSPVYLLDQSYTQQLQTFSTVSVYANASTTVGQLRGGDLTINSGGRLTIAAGGGTFGTAAFTSITNPSGTIDLSDHDLIVNFNASSPIAALTSQIRSAYNGGHWNGAGITSSAAAYATNHGLGIAEASAILGSGGGTFSGVNVDDSSVLIKYTYFGDANLDGKVDILDLGLLASHWQQAGGWYQGDFNYDGKIDILDLGQLATDWQLGATGSAMSFADAMKQFDFNTAVPEPHLLGGTIIALLATRRRRAA